VLEFGVSDDEAFAVGLACGGRIRVMVEPVGAGQGPDEAVSPRPGQLLPTGHLKQAEAPAAGW
jgi:xanthine/CO dehydrogenase XdhC/CoxF family maturation factor